LQVSAANGEHDQISCVVNGKLVSTRNLFAREVVVSRSEIQNCLRQAGPQIEVVKRSDDGWRRKAWDRQIERDSAEGRLDQFAAKALAEFERGETTEI